MQKKITIFVEGLSEQIFLRNILPILYSPDLLSFVCIKFHKKNFKQFLSLESKKY